MAYTMAMEYARLAGMLEAARAAVVRAREAAGDLCDTDEIRASLDDMRDALEDDAAAANRLAEEEARKTAGKRL